ncbi:unnamed protein product [Leptidea sinapis]|uniref:Uncharacterized protein n=1 Tax=Leptidea sinapis TaxID=189913 RepID=A0A5E4PW27_9NEOP|nr:unnamed protein product [Leptidea sinapis]
MEYYSTMSSITARKLTSRQLESKFGQTLDELKKYKNQCEQLLEREESEKEFLKILDQNKTLKIEMAEIY